jgi:phosphatidylinositol phospholipase C gamma-1
MILFFDYLQRNNRDELHFGEKWFHGALPGGRAGAEQLLQQHSYLGDGTFLVRESATFVGDYTLSFWRQGKVNHCRIKNRMEQGIMRYFMVDSVTFDSLYNLVTYYRSHPLRSQEFWITLKEPVPPPSQHESKDWYYRTLTRNQAEDMLKKVPHDGAFLVRPSETEASTFSISFVAQRKIKHCRVKQEGRLFSIGSSQFESLVELVEYYQANDLYKKVKLKIPVTEELVRRMSTEAKENAVYATPDLYMDPNTCSGARVTVKANYDYKAQREDELSFSKNAVITNVQKKDGGWWQGDFGGKKQHWFPANYVQEVDDPSAPTEEGPDGNRLLGDLQQGCVDIMGANVKLLELQNPLMVSAGVSASSTSASPARHAVWLKWLIRIESPSSPHAFEMASTDAEEAREWGKKIIEMATLSNDLAIQHRHMERIKRIAKELSNLIIYCRSVGFMPDRITEIGRNHTEMSSFPETKIEKWISSQNVRFFLWYHEVQFSRVYPKGQRLDSSNYEPIRMWNAGVQMVALNYQTAGKWPNLIHRL